MNAKQQREWEDDVTQPCAFPEPLAEVLTRENRELRAEVERLRVRVNRIADEQQRRFAPYVSRCDRFDATAEWARDYMPVDWTHTSEAFRVTFMAERERAERAEAELADATMAAQNLRDELQGAQERNTRLASALERTEANFRLAVAGKPVRDMAENLAENRAALDAEP